MEVHGVSRIDRAQRPTASASEDRSVPIGEMLKRRGLITDDQLQWALTEQRKTGSRVGAILVAAGLVRRIDLYGALSDEWQVPFVDVTTAEVDLELLADHDPELAVQQGWLPLRVAADGVVEVVSAERPTPERIADIEERVGRRCRVSATTDWDILQGVLRHYEQTLSDEATWGLWRRNPDQSARTVLNRPQTITLVAVVVLGALVTITYPVATVQVAVAVGSIAFLVSVLFKVLVCAVGARYERDEGITDADVAAVADDELPVYTVLVPVYREANVIGDLIGNLSQLDYPAEKLEVFILLEEDDQETIDAARAAAPPDNFVLVTIPDGQPKTKPKACNVGLFLARGDFLVIYDAEDRPEPDQLKKAVLAFERGGDDMVCVQAALNYWNDGDNTLTRMFTLEYSYWFDYMLPGLEALRLPIPLGGTSNHFRTDALRTLGGWDPFNVTEDADLGIRASALGYTVGVVNSTTFEEANRATGNWIRQRSRWIKGYLQTLLVHLRQPRQLVREAGLVPTLAFALLIGGTPLTFLATLPLMALFVVTAFVPVDALGTYFPPVILWIALFNLLVGNAAMVYVTMMGAFKRRRHRLVVFGLLNPFYWLLHSVASYKAAWQLVFKPHYWEKTLHGLSTAPGDDAGDGHSSDEPHVAA